MASLTLEGILDHLTECIDKLKLTTIDDEWVKGVWDEEFLRIDDIPVLYDSFLSNVCPLQTLSEIQSAALSWISLTKPAHERTVHTSQDENSATFSENSSDRRIWTVPMMHKNGSWRSFLALLAYLLRKGKRVSIMPSDMTVSLQAASLYCVLISVPGSQAFSVFHPILYQKALSLLQLAERVTPVKNKTATKQQKTTGLQGKKTTGRQASQEPPGSPGSNDEEADDDGEVDQVVVMSAACVRNLFNKLNELLNAIAIVASEFCFRSQRESLEQTIKLLCHVVSLETSRDVFLSMELSAFKSLASNAYACLILLTQRPKSSLDDCISFVFRNLVPTILGIHKEAVKLTPRECLALRDHNVNFVTFFVNVVGKAAYVHVVRLIQYLCSHVPDRAEYRERASHSVVLIMRELPAEVYHRIINWLLLLAHHEQARYRLIALEVVSRLLREDEKEMEGSNGDVQGPSEDFHPTAQKIAAERQERISNDGCTIMNTDVVNEATKLFFPPTVRTSPIRTSEVSDKKQTLLSAPDQCQERSDVVLPAASEGESMEREVQETESGNHPAENDGKVDAISGRCLIALLYSSSHDSSAQVRAKALTTLADCAKADMDAVKAVFIEILNVDSASQEPFDIIRAINEGHFHKAKILPSSAALLNLVRKRALDDRVVVRKAALSLLANMLSLDERLVTKDSLQVLVSRGKDSTLLIRKFSMERITDLVAQYPQNSLICEKWVETVIPQVFDPESRVVESVSTLARRVIVDNIPHRQMSVLVSNVVAWRLLAIIVKLGYERFFSNVCQIWIKEKIIDKQLMWALRSYVSSSNDENVWCFMALIAHHVPLQDCQFAIDYFRESIDSYNHANAEVLQKLLSVVTSSIKAMKPQDSAIFAEYLRSRFYLLKMPLSLITAGWKYLVTYYHFLAKNDETEAAKSIKEWTEPLIEICEKFLSDVVFKDAAPDNDARKDKLLWYLVTLGCCAVGNPQKITKRIFVILQQIVFAPLMDTNNHGELPLTQPESQTPVHHRVLPPVIQATAVCTLGKLCLDHEEVAEKIIPAFGQLLENTPHLAVRNNVVVALCDMIQRYATKVDPVLPQMTACLKDPDVTVRRNLITYLIDLLQEDYLKLKGTFFFRVLQLVNLDIFIRSIVHITQLAPEEVADPDAVVSNLAQFFITQRLLKKQANILQFHFVECFFHFNGYEGHATYNKFPLSDRERRLFAVDGSKNAPVRLRLYYFMLKNMDDVQRFTVAFKLCKDVLNDVATGVILLSNPKAVSLLQDTLTVLASEDIKMSSLRARNEDEPADMEEVVGAVINTAKKNVLSNVVRKNTIENTVPIIILLKRKLEEAKSPLLGNFMDYMKEVMKDYKNEVKEVLAADKQLATEIEYDLKRYEQEKREREERQRCRTPELSENESNDAADRNQNPPIADNIAVPPVVQRALQRARHSLAKALPQIQEQPPSQESVNFSNLPDLESSGAAPGIPETPERVQPEAPKRPKNLIHLMSTPLRPDTSSGQLDFDLMADLSAIPLRSYTKRIQVLPPDAHSPVPRALIHVQHPEEVAEEASGTQSRRSSRRVRRQIVPEHHTDELSHDSLSARSSRRSGRSNRNPF